jgi:hypothetical protein
LIADGLELKVIRDEGRGRWFLLRNVWYLPKYASISVTFFGNKINIFLLRTSFRFVFAHLFFHFLANFSFLPFSLGAVCVKETEISFQCVSVSIIIIITAKTPAGKMCAHYTNLFENV